MWALLQKDQIILFSLLKQKDNLPELPALEDNSLSYSL